MAGRKSLKKKRNYRKQKNTVSRRHSAPVKKSLRTIKEQYESPIHEEWNGHIDRENVPRGFRDDYSDQLPRIPQYYQQDPFASAVIDRYAPLPVYKKIFSLPKKKKLTPDGTSLRRVSLNEKNGLLRYRDSMDAGNWLQMHDQMTNQEWSTRYDEQNSRPEFFSGSGRGFSRFGRYDEGRNEMKEETGWGSREAKRYFKRAGKHSKRKRK
jgi:hypothetical protein